MKHLLSPRKCSCLISASGKRDWNSAPVSIRVVFRNQACLPASGRVIQPHTVKLRRRRACHLFWQPMDEGGEQMRLDWKISVRRLDKIGSSYPSAFGRESSLIIQVAEVLDHRIAVNDFECVVWKRQFASVANHPLKFTAPFSLHRQIEQSHPGREWHQSPVEFPPSDIEHSRLGFDLEITIKKSHSSFPKYSKELKDRFDIHACQGW